MEQRSLVNSKFFAVLIALMLGCLLAQTGAAQTPAKRYVLVNNVIIPFDGFMAPQTPSGLTSALLLPYGATVSWNASIDADSYRLEHFDPITSQWSQIYNGPNTTVISQNLAVAVHAFRVTACGGQWCSAKSGLSYVTIGVPADTDSDGVFDYEDACPDTHTFEVIDAQGCSTRQRDTDSDGINDAIDLCPDTPSDVTVSAAGCEPTTVDTDGDGVTDDLDRCGSTPTGSDINSDGCAGSQLDSDGDTITDDLDAYPLQHATQCTS